MTVVVAPENDLPNDIKILNQLFEEGLECYHLRKPHKDYTAY